MINVLKQPFYKLKSLWLTKFDFWLVRRIPASTKQILSNRNVFIFPTKFGFVYLFFVLLLFMLGTNYQNNLIMLLSYFLVSLFVSAMLHSFFNLAGLKLETKKQVKGFAENNLYLPVKLLSDKPRYALKFSFDQLTSINVSVVCEHQKSDEVLVSYYCEKRGIYKLPRVQLSSTYALGLFICWTKLDFSSQCLVYPKPLLIQLNINEQGNDFQTNASLHTSNESSDDFYQLKKYIPGESLTQIAWKHLAKGQGWYSKSFQQTHSDIKWLSLQAIPRGTLEQKLSFLCYLCQSYYQVGQTFGLKLNGIKTMPNEGKPHLEHCLEQLALFKILQE